MGNSIVTTMDTLGTLMMIINEHAERCALDHCNAKQSGALSEQIVGQKFEY